MISGATDDSDGQAGAASFTLTERDLIGANRLHWRARLRKLRTYRALAILFLLYFAIAMFFDPPRAWHVAGQDLLIAAGGALAVFAACIGLGLLLLPWRARRLYRQVKAIQRECRVTPFRDAIVFETVDIRNRQPWAELRGWNENAAFLLLYVSDASFHVLPVRALDDAIRAEIRACIAAAGIRKDR